MEKFSDFAQSTNMMVGDKIKIKEVLGVEIAVLGYEVSQSKFENKGDCLKLQLKLNDTEHVLFTGSKVLINQCRQYEDKMPFIAKIVQVNNFYTFQ